jgi:hypothetical protein
VNPDRIHTKHYRKLLYARMKERLVFGKSRYWLGRVVRRWRGEPIGTVSPSIAATSTTLQPAPIQKSTVVSRNRWDRFNPQTGIAH